MAALLRSSAAAASNKGMPSSFYNKDKPNPVLLSLDKEIKTFMGFIKKRKAPDYKKPDEEAQSRPADTLFEIWNKYEPRLPKKYYQEKLLEVGDFLMSSKEYSLALWQCYDRYLMNFGDIDVEQITDVETFKTIFFPQGFDGDSAGLTFRALMGKSISMYQVVKVSDPKLQNKQSIDRCVQILAFLRLVMQVVLPKEKLCWLVYNGTVHIYSISRYLMSLGHSAKVLEFLLWASMCMETSVPLLAVKYLSWRSTLYTAVCQCYFDCKASNHAESFARRGLSKINELSQLETMSSSKDSPEREAAFRQATIKMAIMVFKRTVYETRRRPKGLLRPKTRANLKDAQNLQWPRTPSEKLLHDMFEGSATQYLCILEALSDSNRRILITSPPAPEGDVEILDVYAELFMAAQEILAGGGGHHGTLPKAQSSVNIQALAGIIKGKSLMEMATKGEDGVTIDGAIKLVKFAFCFEQWEVFEVLNDAVLHYLRHLNDTKYLWDEKCLQILAVMEKITQKKAKRVTGSQVEEDHVFVDHDAAPSVLAQSVKSINLNDELIILADLLMSVITGPFTPESIEVDIIVDAALYLWSKCKTVFQKYQTGSLDNPKYLSRMENPTKWVFILDVVHQLLCWCGISSVDPALTAEVVLRLGLVLESSANLDAVDEMKSPVKDSSMSDLGAFQDGSQHGVSRTSMLSSSLLNVNPRNQLLQAREILELGLQNVSFARQAVALTDGKSIADISWAKELNPELFTPEPPKDIGEITEETQVNRDELLPESLRGSATAVWNTIKDLHLELILMYHRVCLKLETMGPDPSSNLPKAFKRRTCSRMQFGSDRSMIDQYVETTEELLSRANKNNLSKALLYMQKALLLSGDGGRVSKDQKRLLENAVSSIQKAQKEEKRTYLDNTGITDDQVKVTRSPPPPILLSRTDTSMVFKPAPWTPATNEKVAWYRIFARNATGSNVKARLSDYHFPGTGEQVPYHHHELRISKLKTNEKYVVALAAYTVDGKLIGDLVGESTKPILANHPLPVLTTWAFLSQISYQIGCYDIARNACDVLWSHFIADKPPPEGSTYVTSAKNDFKLTLMRLNQKILCLSSPVVLRQFLASIFISVDINVREGELFCDVLCDKGPLYHRQLKRLRECEKMLVALELAGWLNESNLALQGVVQCYGLVAPLVFYKIPSIPVFQVLQRCHAVLQEIPSGLRQKRPTIIADSLHHMTACITLHMAKVLRNWGQKTLSNTLNEAGRKLLALETVDPSKDTKELDKGTTVETTIDNGDPGSLNLQTLKNRKMPRSTRKGTVSLMKEHEADGPMNQELKALEAHMLSMSKQAQSDHELSGNEDPNILHAYIAYLPSRIAYREVVKFKKRARYLEFFVHVAQKALTEGLPDLTLDWCEDTENWVTRRNEQIIGVRAFLTKQPGGTMTITGDDPKKFAAAMVEYSKEKEFQSPRAAVGGSKMVQTKTPATSAPKPKRRHKYKAIHVTNNMSEAARQAQEEAEIRSIEKLGANLPDMFRNWHRKRRLRKVCGDELPWKCQLNIVQGLAQFSSFMQKLEKREKMMGNKDNIMFKTNFMDQEWFNFETAGTLIVGWEGGPLHQKHLANQETGDRKKDSTKFTTISERNESSDSSDDDRQTLKPPKKTKKDLTDALDLAGYERPKTTATGIEIAAALTTGAPPPPMFTEPPPVEDTPRTYRSDLSTARMHTKQQTEPDKVLLTAQDTMDALKKSFAFFKKAIVLAHRGRYWTLLQNSARALWNCCHTALLRVYTPTPDDDNSLLTIDELRALAWKPLHMATDCMLDMMAQLQVDLQAQADKAKAKGKKLGEYFESWMGDVKREGGGASLTFENPTDKIGAVDVRFARRLILRMLEILFYEEKWEKLVDVALRFNALTNDRYSEQVIPLLVQAQRNLTEGVQELGGREPPQPHYQALMSKLNSVITAKHYLTQQLELVIDKANLPTVALGAGIDPLGHGLYTSKDALKNISVPLDVPYSLSVLYDAFDKSQYTSRALQHSRKLMILYLSAQQNTPEGMISRQPSRVDFTPNTAQPQPTMPPDISREEYLAPSDVLIAPIPRSQLGTVISSYEKTIEMLLAKNEKELAAQAMHEIGNLHYHASNIRSAYKWWAEALDLILDADDALHTWRDLFKDSEDISTDILPRCGLWGCVLGGVLTSNIAQFVLTSDLGLRTECCFLSGYLFKALFRASLPHPLNDRDYALYDVGEGCEVTNLVPGIDILSEKYRSDGRQVMAALRWVTEELSRGKHNLFVLPLLTLNQFFSTFVCRDLQRTVDGRILKTRVLSDLGLFTEAFIVLQRLLHGERLPHTGDSSFRQVESKISPFKFDTSKPITEPANLKLLENVLDKRLSSSLSTLYGPHMTCHLSVVQAHLFVCVAQTIPVLPNIEDVILPEGHQHVIRQQTISTVSKAGVNVKSMKKGRTASKTVHEGRDPGTDMTFSGFALKRFTGSKKPITLEFVKGTLLVIADQMVGTIADVIQESAELEAGGLDDLSAAELELVVLCKLEQAEIAQLKHHAPMAARIVLASLKLLQASNIFRKKREVPVQRRPSSLKGPGHRKSHPVAVKLAEPENSQYQYQNFQSRSRLDARLWLTCRAALVKSLMTEIRGMGEVKGSDNKVLQELADCRQYCAEGLGESEACGDVEMQADFLIQGASLNIVEGKSLEHTISLLQDAIKLLSAVPRLSIPGAQLLATATVLQTDLMAIEREDDCVIFTERTCEQYLQAQTIILNQMQQLGEKIEHFYPEIKLMYFSTPTSPLRNIYLPHCLRLVQIKLRIGHAMARNAAKNIRAGSELDPVTMWSDALGVLMTALEISRVSVMREAYLEAELLLNIGKAQRMLVYLGKFQARHAVDSLLQAIKISHATDHNLGLMRQAYLEIALIYLHSGGITLMKEGSSLEALSAVFSGSEEDLSSVRTGRESMASKKKLKSKRKLQSKSSKDDINEQEKERRAAWLAIRCAASVANTQHNRLLLIGDPSVTTLKLSEKAQQEIPDFVALDLVSPYVLGEKKKVYKNEIEEELAPLIEAQEVKHVDTYEEQIVKAKEAAQDLSWIHLLGYQTILQRLCSTSTISASSVKSDAKEKNKSAGDLGPEFDLGFISHAESDTSLNHDVIRSMLLSGTWSLRINRLHQYLCANLKAYGSEGCAIYPPSGLELAPTGLATELSLVYKTYPQNLTNPTDLEGEIQLDIQTSPGWPTAPPGVGKEPTIADDKVVTSPSDSEVTLQWYQPSLEETDPTRPDAIGAESRILLLYALYSKTAGSGNMPARIAWVPMSQLNDLHDRLAVLMQRAEVYLQDGPQKKPKKEPVPPSPTPAKGKKSVQRIKALSAKVRKDEHLESLLRQCADDIANLLGAIVETDPANPEIPFEVNRKNIRMLESLFDPSFGATVKGTDLLQWLIKLF